MELNFPIAYSADKQMDLIPYCYNSTSYTQTHIFELFRNALMMMMVLHKKELE